MTKRMTICADVECTICNRVTTIPLEKNGIYFCSNTACGATLMTIDGMNAKLHNNVYIKRTYNCIVESE